MKVCIYHNSYENAICFLSINCVYLLNYLGITYIFHVKQVQKVEMGKKIRKNEEKVEINKVHGCAKPDPG